MMEDDEFWDDYLRKLYLYSGGRWSDQQEELHGRVKKIIGVKKRRSNAATVAARRRRRCRMNARRKLHRPWKIGRQQQFGCQLAADILQCFRLGAHFFAAHGVFSNRHRSWPIDFRWNRISWWPVALMAVNICPTDGQMLFTLAIRRFNRADLLGVKPRRSLLPCLWAPSDFTSSSTETVRSATLLLTACFVC